MYTRQPPKSKGRKPGAESILIRLTYSDIARLAGLKRWTVKRYAGTQRFNPRDIESVIRFCNHARTRRGLPPLGE